MTVRTASFRDFEQIESLYHASIQSSEASPVVSSDRPVPQRALLKLWFAFSKSIAAHVQLTEDGDALYVATTNEGQITGFIQAELLARPVRTWHIVNLCIREGEDHECVATELIEALVYDSIERKIERLSARMPDGHRLFAAFLHQGFQQIHTEQILFCDHVTDHVHEDTVQYIRPPKKSDRLGMYLLYQKATPSAVARLEAPNYHVWEASGIDAMARSTGRSELEQYVYDDGEILGWGAIIPGRDARPSEIRFIVEHSRTDVGEALYHVLGSKVHQGPVTCILRHYDTNMFEVLRKYDFEVYGTQMYLVRELKTPAVASPPRRTRRPVLVHAGAGNRMTNGIIHSRPHARAWALPLLLSQHTHQPFTLEDAKRP